MENILLSKAFNTPFETPPFSRIQLADYEPAFKRGIEEAQKEIDVICSQTEAPTFKNTIEALEKSGRLLSRTSEIFFNLNSAETSDEMQVIARDMTPLLTAHSNEILLNEKLFQRVKAVYDTRNELNLNAEESMLLEKSYMGFVRNGALLSDEDKSKLKEIDKQLSSLSLQFGENVLAETNKYVLELGADDLEGLPDSVVTAAKEEAEQRELPDYAVTLQYPSYVPFMTYSARRDLREKLYRAFVSRAFKGDENDNQQIVIDLVRLRAERAQLLGFESHADFVLQRRMAGTIQRVNEFLEYLLTHAKPAAEKDVIEVEALAKKDGIDHLERWDWSYYSEKLKQAKYDFDDEILKPYFELDKTLKGAFKTAEKLFDIRFEERNDIDVYHPDVKAYEVLEGEGEHIAIFYADFFPRPGKRGGAWMTSFRSSYRDNNTEIRPLVSIVCNFTKPTKTSPSLLTFNEVTTLFHEFGHALHGMLGKGKYGSLTGTSVYWDFVELPSQIMENWCYEKECLDLFAAHYKTGEVIPQDLIEKIKKSLTFQEGYATMRQLSFGLLDMAWHTQQNPSIEDVAKFEVEAMKQTELFPPVDRANMSVSFSHIFQGGYSAGYYSYKWAEVLDADAFESFKEAGVFDKETATSFKENILEKGGTEDPMVLYKRFKNREPNPDPLLRRAGLIE